MGIFGPLYGPPDAAAAAAAVTLPPYPGAGFDTALVRAQRTLIRNGAVTLLSGLSRAAGGYLQAVIPWGGVVRGFSDMDGIGLLWEALNGRAPAMAVALGDRQSKAAGIGGFTFHGPIEIHVYHYSSHARSQVLGRLELDAVALGSGSADPGLDMMLEHADQLMVGQRGGVGTSIKQIVPIAEEELRTEDGFSLWVQRYAVTVDRVINPNRGATELLRSMRSKVYSTEAPSPAGPVVADAQSLTVP